jgi:hypothetical protein
MQHKKGTAYMTYCTPVSIALALAYSAALVIVCLDLFAFRPF